MTRKNKEAIEPTPEPKPRLVAGGRSLSASAIEFAGVRSRRGASIRERLADKVHPEGVDERRELRRQIETDPLTGLANFKLLEAALPAAEADPETAILFIDLNNLGIINKEVTDEQGDAAIKMSAEYLADIAREVVDTDERLFRRPSGDEFAIIAPKEKAEELRDAIISRYGSGQSEHPSGIAKTNQGDVGYVLYGDKGEVVVVVSFSVGIGNTKNEADENAQAFKKAIKPQVEKFVKEFNPDQMTLSV